MALVSLLISFLILFNDNRVFSSISNLDDLADATRSSRSVKLMSVLIDRFSSKKRTERGPSSSPTNRKKRREEVDSAADNFESIFLKWRKRPANLNCARAPKFPKDRRKNKKVLRLMSFNAEWLFLYGGGGSVQCPGIACPWKDLSAARKHINQIVDLLIKIDADIVHLNEVEDCRVLRVIMDLLPPEHGYRAYLIAGTDNMTGQNVGILTKIDPVRDLKRTENRKSYPVSGSTCGRKSSSYISYPRGKRHSNTMGLSKHYLTHFKIGDLKIVWAGAHFIAHPSNVDRCFRREAQAAVLSEFIGSEMPKPDEGTQIIVTGDFNDHDGEVLGANNSPPLSSVLQILKNSHYGLHSAASFVSDPLNRYTSWHDVNGNCVDDGHTEHSLIDHVLLSPGLSDRILSVWMDHNKTVACNDRTSDHWPLIIDLSTK